MDNTSQFSIVHIFKAFITPHIWIRANKVE
jgi:hypothetical protein